MQNAWSIVRKDDYCTMSQALKTAWANAKAEKAAAEIEEQSKVVQMPVVVQIGETLIRDRTSSKIPFKQVIVLILWVLISSPIGCEMKNLRETHQKSENNNKKISETAKKVFENGIM
jgi:hypothetical protein